MLQEGPQCGLVALCMAARLIQPGTTIEPDQIYQTAKERGYTQLGEMFSVKNLCELSQSLTGAPCQVIESEAMRDGLQVCHWLLQGNVFLVPYDCDFNHGPCLAEGRKAHWGLVTGFLVLSNEEPSGADPHFRSVTLDNCESVLASFATKKLLLLGRQSKSLVLGAWDLDELIASNKNLKSFDPKRNKEDYVIPAEGVNEGLANKLIRISTKN